MTLLLLEALGAGLILIGIIWWTMFSGRENGELPGQAHRANGESKPDPTDTVHAPADRTRNENTH
jgi:hypothetical protein